MSYVIAVRALCEFTAKRGDLDLRFTPTPTAEEGQAGHRTVAARRPASYATEVALSGSYGELTVRGRADGYDAQQNRVEEIKTYRGDLDAMRENHRALHWAQVRVYGWLLCERDALDGIELALVYYDVASGRETVLTERASAAELREHFNAQCARFLAWAQQELAHRAARDAALTALTLVHGAFRPGQRELAEAVYRAAKQKRCLLAQAPTGIGKTIGTLFPLLKACPGEAIDKVFFLTAKTSGRRLALDTLDALAAPDAKPLPLRVVEMVARDKACEYPDRACHGESCPLAQGFYDRLPAARADALALHRLDRDAVRDVARAHRVCPYYLSQELARWSDVVVGDYNYYFDVYAMLHALTLHHEWRVAVLVDEAHNLLERGRKMYSASLEHSALDDVRKNAPAFVKQALQRVNRQWNALAKAQPAPYAASDTLPAELIASMEHAVGLIGEVANDQPQLFDSTLQRFYFDALHFVRMAERFDKNSLFDIGDEPVTRGAPRKSNAKARRTSICLRNVVPASGLRARFAAAHSVALFSATLTPAHFYRDMFGLPDNTVELDIGSPFSAEQLDAYAVAHISTRYRDRERSIDAIVELVARQYAKHEGNYLCFFSSFEYLEAVAAQLQIAHPQIPTWQQSRAMDEAAQRAFVARFQEHGCGIGFAVLGGSFGEGIDLPGSRLIGAFVATLGLPQLNPINEQLRIKMDALFGAGNGYDYTYLFPGLQKVVQAAGRVIRTQQDRGVVFLIDDRFLRAEVRALLPAWWRLTRLRSTAAINAPLAACVQA
ncbi:ATP-dependent DNA helicase [Paraburkholderia phosphatilytica]|uniref:ATP-dependent DNA helicase n=1 Tax=Paraburkholderia phosphatilytica TaxID=2282883 RepID=UPI000E4B23FE|nr:ATP-dependent DNA helicase [Paraburkholderia phosphatilytica]